MVGASCHIKKVIVQGFAVTGGIVFLGEAAVVFRYLQRPSSLSVGLQEKDSFSPVFRLSFPMFPRS